MTRTALSQRWAWGARSSSWHNVDHAVKVHRGALPDHRAVGPEGQAIRRDVRGRIGDDPAAFHRERAALDHADPILATVRKIRGQSEATRRRPPRNRKIHD